MWIVRFGWFKRQAVFSFSAGLSGPAIVMVVALLVSGQLAVWGHGSARSVVQSSPLFPGGTILPLALDKTTSVSDAAAGQPIEARVMQEIPLPSDEKIPPKSWVKGSIVSVSKDEDGSGTKITLKFNQVETKKEAFTVVTYLRAMASYKAVRAAQTPRSGADGGTPTGWADTVQIGGDVRFGDGGAVRDRAKQRVGTGVRGGVLSYIRANPARGCDGPVPDQRAQALWVFSADACGVYDLNGTTITRMGKGEPVGEFTLHFEKSDMKLEGGTAMLLRVVTQP